ncbi:MAG TPA: protein kinase [Actinospica sp.]|nr:protein kinase [Actinospica sp.]
MTRRIGSRYTVTRVIGRGTCGTVWSGQGPGGPVAVKLLHEELTADQTLVARFVQERTVLTSLRHPRIVGVRDLVVDGEDLALVMDLMPGPDLRGLLEKSGPLPPAEAVAICADIADALAAAHGRGIVHRDVKPENVLLDAAGRGRLTDFGIARLVDGPRGTRATRIVGTADYLAPEVIEGCPPSPAVDVYALATVLFELTTGWTPFGGGHPGAVLRRHVTEPAPRVPGMPAMLADLLERCLAKAPAGRLSAAEFGTALRDREPALLGLPALKVPSPRGDQTYQADVMTHAGTVPLVQSSEDPLGDDARSTHVNMMRAISEPLDPEAEGATRGGPRRGRWLLAAVGAGLVVLSVLGYVFSQGAPGAAGQSDAADTHTRAATGSAAPTATSTGLAALPAAGDFGFKAAATLPAPASPVVGAVQLAYFDGFLYAAATGQDGNVRVSSVPLGGTATASWAIVPGVATTAQPALIGSPAGRLELYVTSSAGLVQRAVLGAPGSGWSAWQQLGAQRVAGAPAAVAAGQVTQVYAASGAGALLQGVIGANGRFGSWVPLPAAGTIEPQVAAAAQGGKTAVYVVRASDGATMRVYNTGTGWQRAWPTGATGQPATAYAADGHPDLFVLSASAGLQVFQFSGADLHGTMTWASAGVSTANPPGVTSVPSGGVELAVVGADGRVGVYTSAR